MSAVPKLNQGTGTVDDYRKAVTTINNIIDVTQPFYVSPTQVATFTISETYGIYPCDASATAMSAMLPPAASHKHKIYRIVRTKGANAVIVDGDGSETVDGSITAAVNPRLTVFSDGTSWFSV